RSARIVPHPIVEQRKFTAVSVVVRILSHILETDFERLAIFVHCAVDIALRREPVTKDCQSQRETMLRAPTRELNAQALINLHCPPVILERSLTIAALHFEVAILMKEVLEGQKIVLLEIPLRFKSIDQSPGLEHRGWSVDNVAAAALKVRQLSKAADGEAQGEPVVGLPTQELAGQSERLAIACCRLLEVAET